MSKTGVSAMFSIQFQIRQHPVANVSSAMYT